MPQRRLILGIKHQTPAAARSDELAAERAVAQPELVPLVDVRVAHPLRAPLLVLPMLVHERAERAAVAFLERAPTALAELLDVVQFIDHLRIELFGALFLIAQQRPRRAREAGEEEEEVVLEVVERLNADRTRPRLYGAAAMEVEAGDAAVRGDVLVLLADRLAQAVDLDLAGQPRHFARMQQPLAVLVERADERRGEAARGAEAGAGGEIGERGDFD